MKYDKPACFHSEVAVELSITMASDVVMLARQKAILSKLESIEEMTGKALIRNWKWSNSK